MPIPPTAFDAPSVEGAVFTPHDLYEAAILGFNGSTRAPGSGVVMNTDSTNPDRGTIGLRYAPGHGFHGMGRAFEGINPDGSTFAVNPDPMLTHLESEQLHSFLESGGTGVPPSRSGFDPISDLLIPAATAVAFEVNPFATLAGVAGTAAGTAAGHDIGGAEGGKIGGIVGGTVGGAAGGGFSPSSATDASIAAEAGNAAAGGASGLEAGGTIGLGGAAQGGAIGGAGGALQPSGGGGVGPGSSLGTDSSTSQALSGGATGGAVTPGADALGTGAIGGAPSLSQIGQGVNDLASATKFAVSADSLINPPSSNRAQGQSQAGTTPSVTPPDTPPIGGGVSASQIAAQPTAAAATTPPGSFQGAADDFQRRQDSTIRAQFANSGISGSAMEQRAIQQADLQSSQRSTAAQEAMATAGISDQSIFAALMSSGLPPEQFQSVLAQLRARGGA